MKMTELSRTTGVPVPTIKYYLREGLLMPGERTSHNQAQYDEGHVRRLKLIRALIDVGGLSVLSARTVLERMNSADANLLFALGKAQYSTTPIKGNTKDKAAQDAADKVDQLIIANGWQIRPNNPARQSLATVLAILDRLGQGAHFGLLKEYAAAAEQLASAEVDTISQLRSVDEMAEAIVLWTVLGDALLSSMRRLAQESAATQRFGITEPSNQVG